MEIKLEKLCACLQTREYMTAEVLAQKTGMGIKTVRLKIGALNDILSDFGAEVVSRAHYGYKLVVHDENAYQQLSRFDGESMERIPVTVEERQRFTLRCLMDCGGYIKLDDLADRIFVSRTTVFTAVRSVENQLADFDLHIERRPYYGVRVSGLERNKRRLCFDALFLPTAASQQKIRQVRECITPLILQYGVSFSDIALEHLTGQIHVAADRVKRGFTVNAEDDLPGRETDGGLGPMTEALAEKLESLYGVSLCPEERDYLAMLLMCSRSFEPRSSGAAIPLINEKIQSLVAEMLDHVYLGSGVDLKSDLELRIALSLHLIPLDMRLRYGLARSGTELAQTKEYYALAYSCARQACIPLNKCYGCPIPDYETASIALLFAISLEKTEKNLIPKRILIFCASGHNSAQLLAHQYQMEFGQYLQSVETRSLHHYTQEDIDRADCIFTTLTLPFTVSKPVFQVSQFLQPHEIPLVREVLSRDATLEMRRYYHPELFFTGIRGDDREKILHEMCRCIRGVYPLPEEFEELTLERERLAPTDYGNLIAFPHPLRIMTKDTFVCVGVLDEPIIWERNPVQVVLIISVSQTPHSQETLRKFYDSTLRLITDGDGVRQLIAEPTYQTLMRLLSK